MVEEDKVRYIKYLPSDFKYGQWRLSHQPYFLFPAFPFFPKCPSSVQKRVGQGL